MKVVLRDYHVYMSILRLGQTVKANGTFAHANYCYFIFLPFEQFFSHFLKLLLIYLFIIISVKNHLILTLKQSYIYVYVCVWMSAKRETLFCIGFIIRIRIRTIFVYILYILLTRDKKVCNKALWWLIFLIFAICELCEREHKSIL